MHPLTAALPAALAQILRDSPLSQAKVAFAWNAAVGPALERVTAVRLEGSVLLVDAATSAWTREIERSAPMILQRLNGLLGEQTIARIQVRSRT
jgi:hypothetical protein